MKECIKCHNIMELDRFYKGKGLFGYRNTCKTCWATTARIYRERHADELKAYFKQYAKDHKDKLKQDNHRYYEAHKDEMAKIMKEWWEKHPGRRAIYMRAYRKRHPELTKLRRRAQYQANPEEEAAKVRAYYREHIEERRAYSRQYSQDHPEVGREQCQKYRARKYGAPFHFSASHESFARQYWQGMCAVCGHPEGLWNYVVMDHWIALKHPESPGTVPENMLPLCHLKPGAPLDMHGCNSTKHARDPVVWLIEQLGQRRAMKKRKEIEAFFEAAQRFAAEVVGREIVCLGQKEG